MQKSQKRVEEEFKFVIKFASKAIRRSNQAFYYDGSTSPSLPESSSKKLSVNFKTNYAYEVNLKKSLEKQGVSD